MGTETSFSHSNAGDEERLRDFGFLVTGGGLPDGIVLQEPLLGLAFYGGGLIMGHLIAENLGQIPGEKNGGVLDSIAWPTAGDDGPEVGFVQILGNAAAAPVEESQL